MKNIFYISTIITIVYFLFKFIEIKYILNEDKTLKELLRETIMVYLSILTGIFIYNQFSDNNTDKNINVFLDKAPF
tara:strand:- start:842 stop:1069 length:228 start_codon:yes stop_codon:yes gene_type:complete